MYGGLSISSRCTHASRAYMHTIIEPALAIVYNDYTGVALRKPQFCLDGAYLNVSRAADKFRARSDSVGSCTTHISSAAKRRKVKNSPACLLVSVPPRDRLNCAEDFNYST